VADEILANTEAVRTIARDTDADLARELCKSIALPENISGFQRWVQLEANMQVVR
jgi:hypothetical protein